MKAISTSSGGYVEVDLESLCEARASAGWRALYRLLHASRFWARPEGDGECTPDQLFDDSVATGIKVGEQVQGTVRRAIQHLATGFLDAPTLACLRGAEAATRAFYAEALHIRLSRGLVHTSWSDRIAKMPFVSRERHLSAAHRRPPHPR